MLRLQSIRILKLVFKAISSSSKYIQSALFTSETPGEPQPATFLCSYWRGKMVVVLYRLITVAICFLSLFSSSQSFLYPRPVFLSFLLPLHSPFLLLLSASCSYPSHPTPPLHFLLLLSTSCSSSSLPAPSLHFLVLLSTSCSSSLLPAPPLLFLFLFFTFCSSSPLTAPPGAHHLRYPILKPLLCFPPLSFGSLRPPFHTLVIHWRPSQSPSHLPVFSFL
jgi:hypothetical protein